MIKSLYFRKNEHKFRSCRERRRRVSSVDSGANRHLDLIQAFDRIQIAEPEPDYNQVSYTIQLYYE